MPRLLNEDEGWVFSNFRKTRLVSLVSILNPSVLGHRTENAYHPALLESFLDSTSGVEVHGFLCGRHSSGILLLE